MSGRVAVPATRSSTPSPTNHACFPRSISRSSGERRSATPSPRTQPGADERDVVVHALRLGAQHPHVLPDVLDRAAAVVRERRTWRHERIVQAAQARTSARVLTFLPLAFAMWGVATSASVRAAYAGSPVTVVVAAVGVALNTVGWWWMRRVVGGAS